MVKITKQLKEKFLDFCKNEYPRKEYQSNLSSNQDDWFYIQVGKNFSDYLHCEYIKDSIQFHIEFDTKEESEMFDLLMRFLFQFDEKEKKFEKDKDSITLKIPKDKNSITLKITKGKDDITLKSIKPNNKNYIWYEIVFEKEDNKINDDNLFEKMSEAIFLLDEGISKIEGFIKKYFD